MSTIEKAAARLVKKQKPVAKAVPEAPLPDAQPSFTDTVVAQAPAPQTAPPAPQMDEATVAVSEPAPVVQQPAPAPPVSAPDVGVTHECEIDFEHLGAHGFLVPGHENAVTNREFRRIKRPLLLNTRQAVAEKYVKPTNVIFVTSAVSGEGKTFVSMNLALSLAGELDRSVLLLDGDAAKGDLSMWMGIHGEKGLVDLLQEGNGYGESTVIDTNVDRLSVMPSGGFTENLDELYASELMHTLVYGMARRDPNRIIVIDGPPLMATTEAAVLARLAGQVLLVVEASKTPQHVVQQALGQLEGCQLPSALLNKAAESAEAGYGYGYGYGGPDAAAPRQESA